MVVISVSSFSQAFDGVVIFVSSYSQASYGVVIFVSPYYKVCDGGYLCISYSQAVKMVISVSP